MSIARFARAARAALAPEVRITFVPGAGVPTRVRCALTDRDDVACEVL